MKVNLNQKWQGVLDCFSSVTKLDILRMLSEEPLNISELANRLCISPPVITRHVARLESAGLVTSRMMPGKRGIMKVCALCEQKLEIDLSCEDRETQADVFAELPLGSYVACSVATPCGLMSSGRTIGLRDDPRYFQNTECQKADMIWFSAGSLQYVLPDTPAFDHQNLEIEFWMCCKSFGPVDDRLTLTFRCGDRVICTVEELTHASGKRYPDAHFRVVSPLDIRGEKRTLRITKCGTWYNQKRISDFSNNEFSWRAFSVSVSSRSHNNVCCLFGHNHTGFLFRITDAAEPERPAAGAE